MPRVGGERLGAAMSHADCTCGGVPAGGPAQQEGDQESRKKELVLTVASSCNPSLDLWAVPLSPTPAAFWCSACTEQATVQSLTQCRHRVLDRLAGRKPNGSSRPVSPRRREFNIGASHQDNRPRRAWRGLTPRPSQPWRTPAKRRRIVSQPSRGAMSDTLRTGRKGTFAFQATVCALKHRDVLHQACVARPCQTPEAN